MSSLEEAESLLSELLPLADTLPIQDRRYLSMWQQRLSREGVRVHEMQLIWLKELKRFVEKAELRIKKVA